MTMDYLEFLESAPVDAMELGRRAARLREAIGLSVEEAARRAGIKPKALVRFEATGKGTVTLLLRLVRAMSNSAILEQLLIAPRFETLSEVEFFEKRRTSQK
ncbi:MAG: helix-turn-helix domain-containing protein [Sphingomonadales bacterium]|nr:helix-turn-helix domain-containing protein [Sphingomonadales bacterium]MDE2171909.1 helix-turn-helix domain-containing protein [Sphingomonadales bacterium]